MIEYNEQGQELREHGTAAFPIAIYSGDLRKQAVPLHWHGEVEAGYVTKGQVEIQAGRDKRILTEGEGFFVNSGIPHAFYAVDNTEALQESIVLDPILVGGRAESIYWQKYVQPVISSVVQPLFHLKPDCEWQKQVLEKLHAIWQCCDRRKPVYEIQVRNDLSTVFAVLMQNLREEQPAAERKLLREKERILTMMQYIQNEYRSQITIEDIAGSAMISVSECLRCFHNQIDQTPIRYLRNFRIQKAAEELLLSERKIADIGNECGFQEMSYFAKVFREIMGMTPNEYRKKQLTR